MKKKIVGSIAIMAIAAIAAFNVNFSNQETNSTKLSFSNVEALASGENWLCPNGCYDNGSGCYCNGWHPTYEEA